MAWPLLIVISWFLCIFICYCIIRSISTKVVRAIISLSLCALVSHISCRNLLRYNTRTILAIAVCWLMSIRLIVLTVSARDTSITFQSFLSKIIWIFFPYLHKKTAEKQWPINYMIILIVTKILVNHLIYRWSISCETDVTYRRILIFYISLSTTSFILDIEMILVRILTRETYTVETYCDFPLLSVSLREFWGRRYNRIVQTVLKESLFEPIRLECSSSTIGALSTFIISGILHVHVWYTAFNGEASMFSAFMFFLLHGIACSIEANLKMKIPKPIGWIITQTFLLITSPLLIKPFIQKGSSFVLLNPPPLINAEWIPKLPVPRFCL